MAEAYFRILDEDLLEDDMCDNAIKSQLRYAWGSKKDKASMTGDSLRRKWQEIRNKHRNSIISSSNIAQDLHKLPSEQGLKNAYFKFVGKIYKQSFEKKNPMCQIMIDGANLPGHSTSRLEIMVVPSPPNHWEYRDPTLC